MALAEHRNRWKKDLEGIEEDKSIIYPTAKPPVPYEDLAQQGRLITYISKSLHNGIFQIRIDGQEIEVSPAELKALLECG
jgi:hypothetical protein